MHDLTAAGVLAQVDRTALSLYCVAFADWLQLAGRRQRGEAVPEREYDAAFKRLLSAMRECGLSPSSRSGVKALAPRPVEDRKSRFFTTRDYIGGARES